MSVLLNPDLKLPIFNDPSLRTDSLIDQGNFKTVWKVYDTAMKSFKAVAKFREADLSEIPSSFNPRQLSYYIQTENQKIHEQIKHEMSLLLQLSGKPGVIQVEKIISDGIFPAFVMPYYGGGSLHTAIQNGNLSTQQKNQIARDLLTGLAACHKLGIVILDLKPANVLLTFSQDQAVLTDFGCAFIMNQSHAFRENTYALFQNVFYKLFNQFDKEAYLFTQNFLEKYDRKSAIFSQEALNAFTAAVFSKA
jgi:serine/threonine protein kinase